MACVLLRKTICKQNVTPKLKLLYTSRICRETMQWGGDRIVSPAPKGNLSLERIHDFHNVWSEAVVNVLRRAAEKAAVGAASGV
ncbi:hypothetical protein NC652_035052 [Populus alba x Populus x berolinensis]|nr:hypothetical protein NC652_035052 [Populus alba x Populus x berolinensis]